MILRLLLAAFLVYGVDANCKSTDAKWKKNMGPTVVQSSKSDPATLKVSWDKIIENARCVDEWDLKWWPVGGNKTTGQKMNIKSKGTTSKVVSVDPCVEYNFEISFKEKDLFGTDSKAAKVTKYTSNAKPKIMDMDRKNFEVTYYYDTVKKVHDLSKASIKFKKDILENPSCIKFIEIVGVEVPKSQRPKTLTTNRISGRELAPGYGSGGFGSIGGSGGYSGSKGSIGGSGGYPGHSVGGSGGYPGHHGGHGGHGQHPGHNSGGYNSGGWSSSTGRSSYSSIASGGSSSKGSSSYSNSRGGLGSQDSFYSSTSKATTTTYRPPIDDDWYRGKRSLWGSKKKKTTTTPRPQTREPYPGSNIGADGKASGKILPPFRKDVLEVTAYIRPCRSYKFSVKIVSPKGSTLATVKDLFLPLLGEMDAYKPPKLAQMLKVESNAHQFQIKLVPGYGVPGECLGEFFHAVDNHIADLQQDASYHQRQEMNQLRRGEDLLKKLNEQKSKTLTKQFGCKCAANRLLLNTTTAKAHKKHKDVFGTYEYHGEQNGKPYYKKIEVAVHPPLIRNKRFIGNVQSNDKGSRSGSSHSYSSQSSYSSTHSSSSSGTPSTHSTYSSSSSSSGYPASGGSAGGWASQTSLATPKKHDPNFKSYHLYWDAKEKTWVVGLLMDGKKHVLRVKKKKNHVAKCPADPETLHMWEYSGTLSWHDDKLMRASCSLTPSL